MSGQEAGGFRVMRLRDWLILLTHALVQRVASLTDDPHLTTDPACRNYVQPQPGSRLDRASRGVACSPCMVARAFGWESGVSG